MKKTHQNFFNKLNDFSDKPIDYWTHYDLLGYFCKETGMQIIMIKGCNPRVHPQMLLMRKLIAKLKNSKLKFLPTDYDSVETKTFLDFWIGIAKLRGKTLTSVGYIAKNERCYSAFKQDPYVKPISPSYSSLPLDLDAMMEDWLEGIAA